MSLALAFFLAGCAAVALGVVTMFACAYRGIALQRSIGMLIDPVRTARKHGRVVLVARVGLLVAAFGLGLLIAAGVAAIFEAIAAAT